MPFLSFFSSRFLLLLVFAGFISGCTTTGQAPQPDQLIDTGNYKFDAWRLENDPQLEAINVLLDDADAQIELQNYELATDKLERVLRIRPDYAPAWSRLSWLALQTDRPKRAVEMARRSNSLAYTRPELQMLNWAFIRSASELLQDQNLFDEADMQIKALQAF
ncbi:MAG TPA: hypothetical protein ENJ11_02635 [Gammaproteobacteria bacterium]|nr:hypothetical protein [Gammaproteobacteria bacterium]